MDKKVSYDPIMRNGYHFIKNTKYLALLHYEQVKIFGGNLNSFQIYITFY